MAEYQIIFTADATKTLRKLDRAQAKLILSWIEKNLQGTSNPRHHGKALQANHQGKWRYRIGNYRLIAHISDTEITILILKIGHRSDIYR